MKILVYGPNFHPELTGIGKYNGEMVRWLAERGHDVRVIAAPPYYPNWEVEAEYRSPFWRRETFHGATVWRCPLWVPKYPSGLRRLLHLASFALSSFPVMLAQFFWRPHVVWVVEPPLMCSPAALLVAGLCRSKSWLHIQDLEVDAAFDFGLISGERKKRLVLNVEKWLLNRFNVVSTISGAMRKRINQKINFNRDVLLFPNWVDIRALDFSGTDKAQADGRILSVTSNRFRKLLKIPDSAVVALYSGNMGGKQGLEILGDIARRCEVAGMGSEQLHFVFCGNGPSKPELMESCSQFGNTTFLDLQPVELLGELLSMADIHLLPQRADAAELVMPSKLTGIMASGRPVVATAAPETELAAVVRGIVVPPGDGEAMANAVMELALNPEKRARLGAEARLYAEEFMDREKVLSKFEVELEKICVRNGVYPHG